MSEEEFQEIQRVYKKFRPVVVSEDSENVLKALAQLVAAILLQGRNMGWTEEEVMERMIQFGADIIGIYDNRQDELERRGELH
jgi:hypothetical protein